MTDDSERDQSLVGTRLGNRYEIRSEIGRGGMGVVYYGYDSLLQRAVAIKVLPSVLTYDRQFVERFRQEAVAAAGLHHTGIVTIHDVGETVLAEQGQQRVYFIVMQYLEGTTLDIVLQSLGPLTLQQANHLVRQVGDALDYAHGHGMIHRDIKPSNIMVSPDGHATIMDFGLVRAGEGTGLTRTGMVVGTPEYMAPEQALGGAVDSRTDIYSLGVVIYKILTGQVPFTRSNSMATAYAHVHEPPPSLRQTRPEIPKPVEAVVFKALAKAPADRYQRAGLLADDFALAITNKMPAGLKAAAITGSVAPPGGAAIGNQPGGTGAKSPPPRPAKTPTPAPVAAAGASDATQLLGSGAGRTVTPVPSTPPGPQRRRSPGLGVIGLVALLLVAAAAAAVLMLSGRNTADTSPSAAKPPTQSGEAGQQVAAGTVAAVAASSTDTPTLAPSTAIAATNPSQAPIEPTPVPPTATAAAQKPPTATQKAATATPSQTLTPKPPTATPTPAPPTATATHTARPAQTATAAATATKPPPPTATPRPAAPAAPALGAPADGATVSGETTFSWQWNGPALAANQAFEVRLWKEGQPDHYGATSPVRGASTSFNVGEAYAVQQGGSGQYYWTVALVQMDPYQRVGQEAPPRPITVEVGGGGGGDGGGGGGVEPTPTPA